MTDERTSLGSRLRALRVAKGYSVAQAARYSKPPLSAAQAQAIEDGGSTFAAARAYAAGLGKFLRVTGTNGAARKLDFDALVAKTGLDVRTVVWAVQAAMNPEGPPVAAKPKVRNLIGIEPDSPSNIKVQSLELVMLHLSPTAMIAIADY